MFNKMWFYEKVVLACMCLSLCWFIHCDISCACIIVSRLRDGVDNPSPPPQLFQKGLYTSSLLRAPNETLTINYSASAKRVCSHRQQGLV